MTTLTVPGLLLEGVWVPPVRIYGGGTKSLVDIVYSERDNIFPGYYTSKFELSFAQSLEDPLNVDLVLISGNYDAWHLLLVEPSRDADVDSLIANLQTMMSHRFSGREARYLKTEIEGIDEDRIAPLINEQPNFLVVTDDPRNNWSERFAKAGVDAEIMIVEPFRIGERYVLRINGNCPSYAGEKLVGICSEYPSLASCLVLSWNSRQKAPDPGKLEIRYGDAVTQWQVLPGGTERYLISEGVFPLQDRPPFELILEADGTYSFRKPGGFRIS